MMHVYIPTYRRVDRQITLRGIPKEWRKHTTLVVDKQDAAAFEDLGHVGDVLVHPKSIKTIAQKRAWILENTPHRYILMLDDDLRFSRRVYVNEELNIIKLPNAEPKHVGEAFNALYGAMKREGYAHTGIAARQMNNQGSKAKLRGFDKNARCMYALGYDVKVVRKRCELGRIEHREDMDYTLQLLTQGYPNGVYVEVCVDQVYNSKGGASLERSVEGSNRDAEKLAKWFPKFVKVVERAYLKSVPRKEVVVSWKKAYEAGTR